MKKRKKAWKWRNTVFGRYIEFKRLKWSGDTYKQNMTTATVFMDWLEDNGYKNRKVDEYAVLKFYAYLKDDRHVTPATIAAYDRVIRAAYNWVCLQGYMSDNIMMRVPKPSNPTPLPDPFTRLEVIRMLDGLTGHEMETLYKAIITLIYDTGIRSGALCKLKMADIDLGTGEVRITEKGGKHHIVMFGHERTPEALKEWLTIRPECSDYFFLNRRGKPLKPRVVWYALQTACKRSGVRPRKEHNLRKSAGCEWIDAGMPPEMVQKSLNHTDFKVTYEHYIAPAMDRKRLEQMREYSPADRL